MAGHRDSYILTSYPSINLLKNVALGKSKWRSQHSPKRARTGGRSAAECGSAVACNYDEEFTEAPCFSRRDSSVVMTHTLWRSAQTSHEPRCGGVGAKQWPRR